MYLTAPRVLGAVAGSLLLAGLTGSTASAALSCAPDQWEKDTSLTAAPLAVGGKTTRAICQEPTPQPRFESPTDDDWFAFDAPGGKAYTVEVADVGAGLRNSDFDRGGLEIGLARLNADGSTTSVDQNIRPNGDRIITPVLAAGRYVVIARTGESQIYPETNTMDVKTVQGADGIYAVTLRESAPAPVLTALTLNPTTVNGGKSSTGTFTLSAPAPAGGMYVDVASSDLFVVNPGTTFAPAGATRVTFTITTKKISTTRDYTLTAWARVGERRSAVLTVRK